MQQYYSLKCFLKNLTLEVYDCANYFVTDYILTIKSSNKLFIYRQMFLQHRGSTMQWYKNYQILQVM